MPHVDRSLGAQSGQPASLLPLRLALSCIAGREVFTYSGSALRGSLDGLVSILGEAVTQPAMLPWEVKEAAEELSHTAEEQASDARVALLEGLHAAAFGQSSPLGRSVFASPSDLEGVSGKAMRAFLGARFAANKMVLTATSECAGRPPQRMRSLHAAAGCRVPDGVPSSMRNGAPAVGQQAAGRGCADIAAARSLPSGSLLRWFDLRLSLPVWCFAHDDGLFTTGDSAAFPRPPLQGQCTNSD